MHAVAFDLDLPFTSSCLIDLLLRKRASAGGQEQEEREKKEQK